MNRNEKSAKVFVNAIKELAANPKNLDNLELYLSHHFDVWMTKFANTPETLTMELKAFAKMEI